MGFDNNDCSVTYYTNLYGFNCFEYCNENAYGGSVYVSGTTCEGIQVAYTLNFGDCACMDLDFPIITCDNPVIVRECVPPTPTPTITPTNTVTPTITQTPTNTITPTVTPTMTSTPTPTPCIIDCCFSATTNPQWGSLNTITELKSFPDGSIFAGIDGPGTFNGVSLGTTSRIPSCGTPTSDIKRFNASSCLSFVTGIVDNHLYQPQGSKYIFTQQGGIVFRYDDFDTRSTDFNECVISGAINQANINGIYVNNTEQIYVLGRFDGIRNCSGLTTNQTFNTNLYRLNANGNIDITYSGISVGVPGLNGGEPTFTTEKDPNGNVLMLQQSAFTGNTIWRGVLRFKNDGTPDPTFNNSLFSAVTTTQIQGALCQQDGKYMVFGSFVNIGGSGRNRMVRLNSDGTLDTTFSATTSYVDVFDLEQDVYGNYHLTRSGQRYDKLSNSGTLIFSKTMTSDASAVLVDDCSVYIGANWTNTIDGVIGSVIKLDLYGNTNACVLPTPTPTRTPTLTPTSSPTRTPTATIGSTATPTPSVTATITQTSTPTSTLITTSTPTPSVSPTNTETPTSTPEVTATSTPTNTPTNTETPTNTPTSTPEVSPTTTPTITPTITQSPSPSAVCQQIFLYPDNTNPCDHLNTLTQFDTDSALAPTILYTLGGCGTTPVAGNNLWFSTGPLGFSYQVNNSGVVVATQSCP